MQPQTKDAATTKIKARKREDSSLKRKPIPRQKGFVGHASETGKPQQDSSPNLPKPSPVKLPNVAFCRPKETERWCNVTTNKRWCNHQDQGPKTRGFKPQAEANSSSKGLVEHASETGEPQQDSSPNLPKPCAVKLPNVAFWRPKETERWCNATTKQKMMQPPRSRPEEREDWSLKRNQFLVKGLCGACIRNTETPRSLLWRAPPEAAGSADIST